MSRARHGDDPRLRPKQPGILHVRCRLCTIILSADDVARGHSARGLCGDCLSRPEATLANPRPAAVTAPCSPAPPSTQIVPPEHEAKSIVANRATGELRTVDAKDATALTKTEWFPVCTEPAELAQQQHVSPPSPPPVVLPNPKRQPKGTFAHPTAIPCADGMLDQLAGRGGSGFGRFGLDSPHSLALRVECEIYNAWVLLQALDRGLLPPGMLHPEQFEERFWGDDAPDRLDVDEDGEPCGV